MRFYVLAVRGHSAPFLHPLPRCLFLPIPSALFSTSASASLSLLLLLLLHLSLRCRCSVPFEGLFYSILLHSHLISSILLHSHLISSIFLYSNPFPSLCFLFALMWIAHFCLPLLLQSPDLSARFRVGFEPA